MRLGALEDTLVYVIVGDNGASAEGTINGAFNEMANFNAHGRARDAGVHGLGARQVRLARVLQPLLGRLGARDEHALPVDQAGRVALGRHAQRHDRALAEGDHRARRGPQPVLPPHRRRRRRSSRSPAFRTRRWSTGSCRRRSRAPRWPTASTRRDEPERHDLQYFEMFGNRGVYHKGWSAVTKHRTPWVMGNAAGAGVRRRRLGALRRHAGLDAVQRPRAADARQAARAPAAVVDGGDEVQRAPARRPDRRAAQPRHRRPAAARPRQLAGAVRRHGPPLGVQRPQHQEQVVHGHRGGRRRGRGGQRPDHRPGRALRRLVALRQGRQGGLRLQPARASSSSRPRPTNRSRRARTRSGWSSPTTAADSPRAAPSRSTTTACRWARDASSATQPFIFSADETTDVGYDSGTPVSADTPPGRFTGTINWVQLDLGDDTHDHLVDPDHVMRVAMSLQ